MLLSTTLRGFGGNASLSDRGIGGLGDVSEGTVSGMLKHLTKLRNELAKATATAAHAKAEYGIAVANRNKKWSGRWRDRLRAATATMAGRRAEYNAQLAQYNAAKAELAAAQAAEMQAAAGDGGGGGYVATDQAPSSDEGPPPEEAPPDDSGQTAGISGLFSGAGEPAYLPLGKVGTPLALFLLWKYRRKIGRALGMR